MRALKMTQPHNPAAGQYGDCFRTALACLLDCDSADDVPHFFGTERDADIAYAMVEEWLNRTHNLGLYYSFFQGDAAVSELLEIQEASNPGTFYILCGNSHGGNPHAVVACGGSIVHDPSWRGTGIAGPGPNNVYMTIVLIPASLKV